MLRFLTAGESHGKALVAILEGVPAGLAIDLDAITTELRRRQTGYGRGRRMLIESDRAEPLSGVRHGLSTGGPIALLIPNKDWENWQRTMHVEPEMPESASGVDRPLVTRPRPGHADLAGFVKYGHEDMRNVLERASARETAARVAVGAVARQLLRAVGTDVASHVTAIGSASVSNPLAFSFQQVRAISAESPLHCAAAEVELRMIAEIDRAVDAGGLEGGVTNGEELRMTAYMKPISTLMKPLRSVDLSNMTESPATIERSDVCAVPAAAVVGEAMVSIVLADAAIEKFGGDSIE